MSTSTPLQELEALRETVADLRFRLEAANRRIERLHDVLERTPSPVSQPAPEMPKLQPLAEVVPQPAPAAAIPPPLPPLPDPPQPAPKSTELPKAPASVANPPGPKPPAESFELRLGQVWLVRIGMLVLLTGLVFLGNFAYREYFGQLGAAGRLGLIYLAAGLLGAVGTWLSMRRPTLKNYARVLLGGGLATGYYATFAAHFVEPLRVLSDPLTGGIALLAYAGGVLWLADRLQSRTVAAVTLALAFYTSALNSLAVFALFSNLLLAAVAMMLLLRRGWVPLSFLSLAGTYGALLFWRWQQGDGLISVNYPDQTTFLLALIFPLSYWVLFTISALLRPSRETHGWRTTLVTLNNAALFALCAPVIYGTKPDIFWITTCLYGVVLLGLGIAVIRSGKFASGFESAWLTQGLILLPLGFAFHFTGYQLATAFALQTALLISLSHLRHSRLLLGFSAAMALLSTIVSLVDIVFDDTPAAGSFLVTAILAGTGAFHLLKRRQHTGQWPEFSRLTQGLFALAATVYASRILDMLGDSAALLLLLIPGVIFVLGGMSLHRRELAHTGHGLALAGAFFWIITPDLQLAIWPVLAVVAASLTLAFWAKTKLPSRSGLIWQSLQTLSVVLTAWIFIEQQWDRPYTIPILAAAGLGLLVFGLTLRIFPTAIGSCFFSTMVLWQLGAGLIGHQAWLPSTIGWVLLAAQSPVIFALRSKLPVEVGGQIHQLLRIFHLVLTFTLLWGMMVYLPADGRFIGCCLVAAGLFGVALWRRHPEPALHAAAFLFVGCMVILSRLRSDEIGWINAAGFLLILAAQQLGRRRLQATAWFPAGVQVLLILLGVVGLWYLVGSRISDLGVPLTVVWSMMAFLVLGAGFILRDRTYRLCGLGILAVTLARVFLVDVWQLETLFRIVSFLVLGVVLLALGFLYNRFSDQLKRWL